MSRWEPNARGRLERAAMELYIERGFEQTTVAEIAARAGLTERTFFRHFADKREVLFAGAGELQDFLVSTLAGAPDSAAPIDAVAAALEAAGALLQERRDYAGQRPAVIAANVELQERGLIKLASPAPALPGPGARRHVAPARRHRPSREPGCRGRDRCLQDRVRTLDQRNRPGRLAAAHPRVARRAQSRDRRQMITGGRPGAKSCRLPVRNDLEAGSRLAFA